MNIDIYEPWSNKIEILNFNQKYLSINEPSVSLAQVEFL